jgi:hypothetical protein
MEFLTVVALPDLLAEKLRKFITQMFNQTVDMS